MGKEISVITLVIIVESENKILFILNELEFIDIVKCLKMHAKIVKIQRIPEKIQWKRKQKGILSVFIAI